MLIFWKINLWRHHKLVGSGQYFACDGWVGSDGVTENGSWTSL